MSRVFAHTCGVGAGGGPGYYTRVFTHTITTPCATHHVKRLTAALGDAIHRDDPSPAGIRDEGAERTKPTRVVHAMRRNRRPY